LKERLESDHRDWALTYARSSIRVETEGIRPQTVALAATALEPKLFSGVFSNGGMSSFRYLLDAPVQYRTAPDLFVWMFSSTST
jgi:hypothetical protein